MEDRGVHRLSIVRFSPYIHGSWSHCVFFSAGLDACLGPRHRVWWCSVWWLLRAGAFQPWAGDTTRKDLAGSLVEMKLLSKAFHFWRSRCMCFSNDFPLGTIVSWQRATILWLRWPWMRVGIGTASWIKKDLAVLTVLCLSVLLCFFLSVLFSASSHIHGEAIAMCFSCSTLTPPLLQALQTGRRVGVSLCMA